MDNTNEKCRGCDPAEGFCRDCREAERASKAAGTGTTASAAGTAVKMPAPAWPRFAQNGADAYSAHQMQAYGAALAEEARREANDAINALAQIAVAVGVTGGPADMVAAVRKLAAQRTAGGDAVAYRWRFEGWEAGTGWQYATTPPEHAYRGGYILEALGVVGRPVAEAAAQADDLPPLTLSVYGTITALELERQRRADIAARAAAPTAQPTPQAAAQNEANGPQTRMDAHPKPLIDSRPAANAGRIAAQPTPPDDERARLNVRAAFEKWVAEPGPTGLWAAWRTAWTAATSVARRQPSALPDEKGA